MGHLGVREKKLKAFLARVNQRFPLERAILFGSRARGDELKSSDYDLILVSPAFLGLDFSQRIGEVLRLWDLEVGVEPLCYTPEEFEERSRKITVVAESLRQGRQVWPD
ncbi:MAG TPA: nucleotidyltransferase [Candidatus Acetothermia bacterium]|nr:nucleotidyltransferase [Candidatus Acetothermia bacterium]